MSRRPPTTIRPVFIDSSAYFALADPTDAWHEGASSIDERLRSGDWRLVTTNFVVAEAHARILSRRNRFAAAVFLESIDTSPTTSVISVDRGDELHARQILRRYRDKDFSLIDALSFAVIERFRIQWAFAFDDDFRQYGKVSVLDPEGAR